MVLSNRKYQARIVGEPAAFFTKEEISNLAAPFRSTLVGKFSYYRPKMKIIRKFFHSLDLKSLQSVGLLQENHIAIFITKEEDYTRLLMRSTWYIAGTPMKVLKWSPDFYPSVESPVVPVWVGLPGLPLHFFEKLTLFCIASALGTPLKVDEPTANLSRPTVARVCIEIDVSNPKNCRLGWRRKGRILAGGGVYENPPLYCDFCKVLGHDSPGCFKKNPSLKPEKQKLHVNNDALTQGKRISAVPQKIKESVNRNETWKKKEVLQSLPENNNENEWTVVGGKHKPKNTSTLASVVPDLCISEKENKKVFEGTAEEKEIRNGRISGNLEKTAQTAMVVKVGDRQTHFPPLLRQHLSSSGIALTPFPDLANKKGKGVKGGNEDRPEPISVKNKDSSPSKKSQQPASQKDLPEMAGVQSLSSTFLLSSVQNQPLDVNKLSSQPLVLIVREEPIQIQPSD